MDFFLYPETDASFHRHISAAYHRVSSISQPSNNLRSDLDSHADTCCVGSNAFVHHESSFKTIEVQPFLNSLSTTKQTPIVSASVANDSPFTLKTYVAHIHQALNFPELEHNLINPNQCRLNDVIIDECPKFLSVHATDKTHSIYLPCKEIRFPHCSRTEYMRTYQHASQPDGNWIISMSLSSLPMISNGIEHTGKLFQNMRTICLTTGGHHRTTRNRVHNFSVAALGLSQVTNSLSRQPLSLMLSRMP